METDLSTPRYTQPQVLQVTGLSAPSLQTWVNRGFPEQMQTGIGRRRLYSKTLVAQLAVARRLADFGVALKIIADIAIGVREELEKKGSIDWFFSLRMYSGLRSRVSVIGPSHHSRLNKYGAAEGDWRDLKLPSVIEQFESTYQRRERLLEDGYGPIIPEKRDAYASIGIHAEPVLFIPLGEIVNGALRQLQRLDDHAKGTSNLAAEPETGVQWQMIHVSHKSGDVEITSIELPPLPLPQSFDGHDIFARFSFRLKGMQFNRFVLLADDKDSWIMRQTADGSEPLVVLSPNDTNAVEQAAIDAIGAHLATKDEPKTG